MTSRHGATGAPWATTKRAFGEPVLGHPEGPRAGSDGHVQRLDGIHEPGRHVLQLVGDHGAVARQPERGLEVVVATDLDVVRDDGRGACRVGVEHPDAIPEGTRGVPQHAAQLPSTQDADGGGRQDGARGRGRHACIVAHPGGPGEPCSSCSGTVRP